MRRFLLMLGIACFLLCSHLTYACGDKLLVLGRPLRFGSSRPAAILAYAPSGSFLESVMKEWQFATAITKGKHRLRVVQTPEQLTQTLKAERFDLVLAGSQDVLAVRSQVAAATPATVFVPVVDGGSRDAVRTAEKEYGVAIKGNAKTGDYLSTIGRAVDLHDRRVEAVAREKKNPGKNS
jgi:hypothetical protein